MNTSILSVHAEQERQMALRSAELLLASQQASSYGLPLVSRAVSPALSQTLTLPLSSTSLLAAAPRTQPAPAGAAAGEGVAASRYNEAKWSAVPTRPAAANSFAHVQRKPSTVLYARLQPQPPHHSVFESVVYAVGVAVVLAYGIYFLVLSRTSDRYFGAVLLAFLLFWVGEGFQLLPGEQTWMSRRVDAVIAKRSGDVIRVMRRSGTSHSSKHRR